MQALFRVRNLIFLAVLCLIPVASYAQIAVSIRIGPPALPVYTQPPCPDAGYIWTPGYWAWGPDGYYWVPGVWVEPPAVGLLWTPGYWGFDDGLYAWHAGYWGPHVGFYGGIDYGFGYYGSGFVGGRWEGGHFAYNTAVWNVNRTVVRNVYVDRTVVRNNRVDRVSFNGRGGVTARPSARDEQWARERHVAPTSMQDSHQQNFRDNHNALASVNHGHPQTVAMTRVNSARSNEPGRANEPNRSQPNRAQPNGAQPNRMQPNRTEPNRGQPAPKETNRLENRATQPSHNSRPEAAPKNNVRQQQHFQPLERQNQERPNQTRPNESRPTESRSNQVRPNESRPTESRPAQPRAQQERPQEARPTEARPEHQQAPHESRPPEQRQEQARPQHESGPSGGHAEHEDKPKR